jgi:hypothetical protein
MNDFMIKYVLCQTELKFYLYVKHNRIQKACLLVLLLLVLKLADGWADKTSPLHGI